MWITLLTQSCLVLYFFCANLLHSLIMWLMVSPRSPHDLHLLFCRVLSILALIWLVLMALFCAAIRRDSVSLRHFLFLNHVQVFLREMLFIRRFKTSWELFFSSHVFHIYSHSVVHRIVCLVSDGCNQSFFGFFCVVLASLYRCVNAFNAGKSSSSILFWSSGRD